MKADVDRGSANPKNYRVLKSIISDLGYRSLVQDLYSPLNFSSTELYELVWNFEETWWKPPVGTYYI